MIEKIYTCIVNYNKPAADYQFHKRCEIKCEQTLFSEKQTFPTPCSHLLKKFLTKNFIFNAVALSITQPFSRFIRSS